MTSCRLSTGMSYGDIDDTMSNESDDVLTVDPCLMDSEDELVIDGSVICQYDSDIDDEQ
jgi:hypothetical protein